MADSPANDSFNESSLDGSKDSSHFASSFKVDDQRPSLKLYSTQSINKHQYQGSKDSDDDSDQDSQRATAKQLIQQLQQQSSLQKSYADADEDDDDRSSASRTSAINRLESKFETAYIYKQSTEDIGDEYQRRAGFHDDEEEEVIPSPAAASSLQSSSFKLEADKKETDEALQFKFTTNYQMSEREFKAQKAFFDRIQGGGRASIKLVFKLLAQQLDKRSELIQANKEDIGRVVHAMDADEDGLISLNEFVDLLQLFFAKADNVRERIEMMLNNRSFTNLKSYSLSPDEARSFLNFLDDFYGAPAGTSSSLRIRPELNERVSNAKFAELVAPIYAQLTYLL